MSRVQSRAVISRQNLDFKSDVGGRAQKPGYSQRRTEFLIFKIPLVDLFDQSKEMQDSKLATAFQRMAQLKLRTLGIPLPTALKGVLLIKMTVVILI